MDSNQKMLLMGAGALLVILLLFTVGAPIVAKLPPMKRAVIQELKQDKGYCPSPYGPGFNPDDMDLTEFQGWN